MTKHHQPDPVPTVTDLEGSEVAAPVAPIEAPPEVTLEDTPPVQVDVPVSAIIRKTSTLPAIQPAGKYPAGLTATAIRGLNLLTDPSLEEIMVAGEKLEEPARSNFRHWFELLFTEKQGVHAYSEQLRVPELRIFQGTGKDPMLPTNAIKGCVYDSDGNMLTAPSAQAAKQLGVPERFDAIVISAYETKIMRYPRDKQSGNPIPLPGLDPKSVNLNMPICVSMDRIMGSRYQTCKTCEYNPRLNKIDWSLACKDAHVFFLIKTDWSTIYKVNMRSSSIRTGATPITKRTRSISWPVAWHKSFTFEVQLESKGNNSWFAWKTSVNLDPAFPQGIPVPSEQRALCELLSRKMDALVYYPNLLDVYERAAQGQPIPGKEGNAEQLVGQDDVDAEADPGSNF